MHAPAAPSSAVFATPATRPAIATVATLLLAVAAAAFAVFYGEPAVAAAAAVQRHPPFPFVLEKSPCAPCKRSAS